MVLCTGKDRGDRLLQSGRSDLAALTYLNALQKISSLREYWLEEVTIKTRGSTYSTARNSLSFLITSGPFKDLKARYATKALKFKVQASMTTAYSRSGRHRDVIDVAEAALYCDKADPRCASRSRYNCGHSNDCLFGSEGRDWAKDQKSDYAKIHYHKALALEKLGDMPGAIENMEKALSYDAESDMAVAELSRLKQKLEEMVAHDTRMAERSNARQVQLQNKRELKDRALRQQKARKLNSIQDRLLKKQIRRRENA